MLPQQAHLYNHRSLVARIRLASVVRLASARMTSCEYSTPNAALMLIAIRFACFGDQNRKSSADGWESASTLSTSTLLGSTADVGRRDGSASRQRLMMRSKLERTLTKSNDDGLETAECVASQPGAAVRYPHGDLPYISKGPPIAITLCLPS